MPTETSEPAPIDNRRGLKRRQMLARRFDVDEALKESGYKLEEGKMIDVEPYK